jgi:hypothetical protein
MIKVSHRLVGVNQHRERDFTRQSLLPRGQGLGENLQIAWP